MTRWDDGDLLESLRTGLAEREAQVSAPAGLAARARRAARRRTVVRVASAGAPVLAVAALASVLATRPDSHSRSAHAVGGPARPVSTATGASGRVDDTAYIVRRVRTKLASDSARGTVVDNTGYAHGTVRPDGTLAHLGWRLGEVYDYTAPDGAEYQREVMYERDGRPYLTVIDRYSLHDGRMSDTQTIINTREDTYSRTRYSVSSASRAEWAVPNLYSSPSEVRRALLTGRVSQSGSARIHGTGAIVLSMTVPGRRSIPGARLTLYVDARTYRPLRTVTVYVGVHDIEVADWVPATATSIARA